MWFKKFFTKKIKLPVCSLCGEAEGILEHLPKHGYYESHHPEFYYHKECLLSGLRESLPPRDTAIQICLSLRALNEKKQEALNAIKILHLEE
jgi:hypothetical protein